MTDPESCDIRWNSPGASGIALAPVLGVESISSWERCIERNGERAWLKEDCFRMIAKENGKTNENAPFFGIDLFSSLSNAFSWDRGWPRSVRKIGRKEKGGKREGRRKVVYAGPVATETPGHRKLSSEIVQPPYGDDVRPNAGEKRRAKCNLANCAGFASWEKLSWMIEATITISRFSFPSCPIERTSFHCLVYALYGETRPRKGWNLKSEIERKRRYRIERILLAFGAT